MTHLAAFVKTERLRRGLNPQKLAADVGYRNVNKGANKITRFEEEGVVDPALFDKLVRALELDIDRARQLSKQDQEETERAWEEWATVPTAAKLVVKLIPGVFHSSRVPDHLSEAEAVRWARQVCLSARSKGCLVLSRKESVWIEPDGSFCRTRWSPNTINQPTMTLKGEDGQPFVFAE